MNNKTIKEIEDYQEMLQQMNEFSKTAMILLREKAKRELDDYARELLK